MGERFWIPLYIYPNPATPWTTVIAGAPTVEYIVANPASGPGGSADPNYTTVINAAIAAGITVLGYVDTAGGAVSTSTVHTQVTAWSTLYGVSSIFFDNAATSTGELSYYTTVCGYPAGKKVLNHGAIPVQGYALIADVLMVFENAYAYWAAFSPPAWFASYPPSKFGVNVYNVNGVGAMEAVVGQAAGFGAGVVCVTDENDDLFGALPSYLAAELAFIKAYGTPAAMGSNGGSWWGLDTVFKQSRQEFEAFVSRPPMACPECGEPLTYAPATKAGSGVERYCKFDGWQYPRDYVAPSRPWS